MTFAGDTFTMLKKVYYASQQNKLSLHTYFEVKTVKNGRFRKIMRVGFRDFGGSVGRCPPNSNIYVGIPSLGFF